MEYQNLDTSLNIIHACTNLQPHNIAENSQTNLKKHLVTVHDAGIELPLKTKIRVTALHLAAKLEAGDAETWAAGVWPWSGDDVPEWDFKRPTFHMCRPASGEECEAISFKSVWVGDAVFCPAFQSAFSAACDANTVELLKFCRLFLKMAEETRSPPPTFFEDLAAPTMKTMRGLVALLSPIPQLHQCKVCGGKQWQLQSSVAPGFF